MATNSRKTRLIEKQSFTNVPFLLVEIIDPLHIIINLKRHWSRTELINADNVLIVFENGHFTFSSSKQKRFIVNNAGVINLIFRSTKFKAHLTHTVHNTEVPICHFLNVSVGPILRFFFFFTFLIFKRSFIELVECVRILNRKELSSNIIFNKALSPESSNRDKTSIRYTVSIARVNKMLWSRSNN